MDEWVGGWMAKQVDEWMDIDRWMNGWKGG